MVPRHIGVFTERLTLPIEPISGYNIVPLSLEEEQPSYAQLSKILIVILDLQHPGVTMTLLLKLRPLAFQGRVVLYHDSISRELKHALQRLGFRWWLPGKSTDLIGQFLIQRATFVEQQVAEAVTERFEQQNLARSAIESALINGFAV